MTLTEKSTRLIPMIATIATQIRTRIHHGRLQPNAVLRVADTVNPSNPYTANCTEL